MSAEAALLTRSWKVGDRTCHLTVPRPTPGETLSACIEWHPEPPRQLSAAEWTDYRAGRNAAITEIAEELGINVAVLEL